MGEGTRGPTLCEDLEAAADVLRLGLSPTLDSALGTRLRAAAARLRDRMEFLRDLNDPRMAAWRLQVLGELEVIDGGGPQESNK